MSSSIVQGAVRAYRGFAVVALVLAMLAAMLPSAGAADPGRVVIESASGRHEFTIEWAATPAERSKGLMFRESMPADHGMLFDFGVEQPVAFWMRNTPLSLDMLFIAADGTIRRIEKRATPFSEDHIPSGAPVRYVLELNGGTSDRLGLAAGDRAVITPR